MSTHTHVGYRKASDSECRHIRSGRNLKGGKRHALVADDGIDRWYRALCGKRVYNERTDMYGDPIVPNVRHVGDTEARPVTRARCQKVK